MALARRSRALATSAVLSAALVAVFVLAPGRDPPAVPEPEDGPAAPGRAAPPPPPVGRPLEGRRPQASPPAPPVEAPRRGPDAAGRTLRVLDADGSPVREGEVRVVRERRGTPGGWDVLATAPLDAEGNAWLPQASLLGDDPPGATLVVTAYGLPTLVQKVLDVPPEGRASGAFTLSMPKGVVVAGRVVDPDGKGVADLPLVLTAYATERYAVFGEDFDLDRRLGAVGPDTYVRTKTGPDGAFEARVNPGRTLCALADHEAWILQEPSRRIDVAEGGGDRLGLRVLAWPAVTLRGTVTDAGTGKALAGIHVAVALVSGASGAGFRFGAPLDRSPFRVTWGRAGLDRGTQVFDVAFEVPGYVPERTTATFGPAESLVVVDVRLRTVASAGGKARVRFEIADSDGRPLDLPFFLEVRTTTPDPTVLSQVKMTRRGGGTYAAEVPPGTWDLRVVLPQHFYWMASWHGPVTAETEREAVVRCEIPAGAPLVVRWKGGEGVRSPTSIAFRRPGEPRWNWESVPSRGWDQGVSFVHWPAGEWEFAAGPEQGPSAGSAATVRVAVGSAAKVDLGE